jgi:integrase
MAVRKFKGSWWVDFRFNSIRYRKRSPDNSRAGARVYETTLRSRLAKGEAIDVDWEKEREKIQSFEKFSWTWFEIYVKNNNKISEVKSKESILKAHLVPFFGKTPINGISSLKIEQYKAKKSAQGLSAKTVNNHLTVLNKCLKIAKAWLELDNVPVIKWLKVPPQKYDFLSPKEGQSLLDHAQGIWREMILLAMKTGLRYGELRALVWSDINWNARILTVRRSFCRNVMGSTKSNRERHIPLTGEVCRGLSRRRQNHGLIFSGEDNQPLSNRMLYESLRAVCRKAQLRQIGWHTLRHTFASHLAMAGASMKAIQELMGHSDIKTTLRYAHLTPSVLRNTVELLEPETLTRKFGQPAVNRGQDAGKRDRKFRVKKVLFLPEITQKQEPKLLPVHLSG